MTGPVEIRRRLPNRRGHELLSFEHGGIRYTAGVGKFENGDLSDRSAFGPLACALDLWAGGA